MDPKKFGDFAGRFKSGGKGLGTGFGFLAAAAGLAYGVSQSIYTGNTASIATRADSLAFSV